MNNEKKYITPEMNVISLENEDIICTSNVNKFGNEYNADNGDFWKDTI